MVGLLLTVSPGYAPKPHGAFPVSLSTLFHGSRSSVSLTYCTDELLNMLRVTQFQHSPQ